MHPCESTRRYPNGADRRTREFGGMIPYGQYTAGTLSDVGIGNVYQPP